MESISKLAVSEVIDILNHTDKEIIKRVPDSFISFLLENSDNQYVSKINFNSDDWDMTIQEDAKALLAIIYRDYIVSPDEKEKLIVEEKKELDRIQKEMRDKYNPDIIFKKNYEDRKEKKEDSVSELAIVECKDTIFKKIINMIKKFFHKV